ncbi:MAG: type II toxin-antitoxin system PemK/MazF family toxin [Candidatus Eisenbacteria bacterium]|nr:type II toxin-antitoxin system PemK/MazF family toxin [Candidatus Eisenbacteria bacterium]
MKRADLYRVRKPTRGDPKKSRVFVVVSRLVAIDSKFSTVICAPVYTSYDGLSIQIAVGTSEGLQHDCSIHCDELVSIPKSLLSDFVGRLGPEKQRALDDSLAIAVGLQ